MKSVLHTPFSKEQLPKIGNTVVYLAQKTPALSKTKLLKLLYILDELSITKSGIPFLNLEYKVWKFGPVSQELYIDLSAETTHLKDYVTKVRSEDGSDIIVSNNTFNDDEFSDNDIELMNFVINEFGGKTAKELISYTHRKNAPWHNTALANSVLEALEQEHINSTDFVIDLGQLVEYDERKKEIYSDYIEYH
jgi:uncharacterized phage-associated protein